MEIKLTTQGSAPARLVTCFEDHQPVTGSLDANLARSIQDMVEDEVLSTKFGAVQVITLGRGEGPRHIIFAGLGKAEDFTPERARRIAGRAIKQAQKLKVPQLDLEISGFGTRIDPLDLARAIAEGAMLASYKFDKFKSERKENPLKQVNLLGDGDAAALGLAEGLILAEATNLARGLVDEPSNLMTPAKLADEAERIGSECGFEVTIRDEAGIRALGMEAFLMVGQGSDNPPRLIVMKYRGNPSSTEVLGLVGKGLTYDSGGLSLKPRQSMEGMKGDMAGAAAVIGAMAAISKLKVKVNLVGVIAACENMVSGRAYKVDDIIGSMSGQTIEIFSTDAEGRLTLADAVYYAVTKEKATRVLDIATLTGAAIVALGNLTTPVLANDDQFYAQLQQAADLAGEKIWRLPHDEEYKELIKSEVADLRNTSRGGAGTITAGLFVGAFVEKRPWLHLDIAGTAWTAKEGDYHPKGATGAGVRTICHLAKIL
jgi:leucyl aminopeptidase